MKIYTICNNEIPLDNDETLICSEYIELIVETKMVKIDGFGDTYLLLPVSCPGCNHSLTDNIWDKV